ncbi:MAG: CHASE2 domain-containing protein [Desulforhopalus sp.]
MNNYSQNILIRTFFNALVLTAIFFINPFGLRTSTEKYSEDLVIGLLSPWYPEKFQNEVTIILLDDFFIEEYGKHYPVDYSDLKQILKVIGHYQPKAVFFDLLQHYEHSDGLDRWLQQIEKSDFPVYMASSPAFDTQDELNSPDSLRYKLKKHKAEFTAVSWFGYQHYYPLLIATEQDQQTTSNSTAALSLFREWCEKTPTKCQYTPEELGRNGLFQNAMVVRWSNTAVPEQENFLNLTEGCQDNTESKYTHLFSSALSHFEHGFSNYSKRKEQQRSRCFHLLTLTAASLFKPAAMDSESLRKALTGRIVVVGYNLIGGPDAVQSPLHGKLPGVFFHAMALDNLINLGDAYWHVPENIFGDISISRCFEGLLQGLVLWLVFTYRYSHLERRRESLRDGLLCLLCLSLVSFLLVMISIRYLKLGPMNWFALAAVVSLAIPTFLYHKLIEIKLAIIKKWQREDRPPQADGPEMKASEGEGYENAV